MLHITCGPRPSACHSLFQNVPSSSPTPLSPPLPKKKGNKKTASKTALEKRTKERWMKFAEAAFVPCSACPRVERFETESRIEQMRDLSVACGSARPRASDGHPLRERDMRKHHQDSESSSRHRAETCRRGERFAGNSVEQACRTPGGKTSQNRTSSNVCCDTSSNKGDRASE